MKSDLINISKLKSILLFSLFGLAISSCNLAKKLPENEFLLHKNEISIVGDCKAEITELEDILKQKPNRKIAGVFRFHLFMYNLGSNLKDSKIKNWLTDVVGEEPVTLDSLLLEKSSKQLNLFLKNKGYFNNIVKDSIEYRKKKKKAINHFTIYPGEPYKIGQITISMMDDDLLPYIQLVDKVKDNKPILKKGDLFDVDRMDKERDRITYEMQNLGFYYFEKEHISYQVDSTIGNKKIRLKQIIKNPTVDINDSLHILTHNRYRINEIMIRGNQTLSLGAKYTDKLVPIGSYKFKSDLLYKNIFINPGEYYNLEKISLTYNRLLALKVFRRIDIGFEPNTMGKDSTLLNCFVTLTPLQKHSFALETNGTHRSGSLGLNANLTYRNRNLFHAAEILEFKSIIGLEAQIVQTGDIQIDEGDQSYGNIFNTFEYGFESTLYIPGIIGPFKQFKDKLLKPKTNFTGLYNFQSRTLLFTRNILNFQFRYTWSTTKTNQFSFSPLDISTIKIELDTLFENRLNSINNPFLTNSYQDHLVFSTKLGYTFSNQQIKRLGNHIYLNTTFESAGNSLRLINNTIGSPMNDDGSYNLLGIQYAHFVKADIDLRLYYRINKFSNIAYRLYSGVGVPLQNFQVLPFEKSFFAGGANGIRAWQARTLGPGSYTDPSESTIDKIGDIKLEGNVEYRFKILKLLEGAVFVDAGNIWVLRERVSDNRKGSVFKANKFLTQIAIGSGIGMRLDLSFFIVRFDMGVKIYDPAMITGEEWIYQPKTRYMDLFNTSKYQYTTFNLGIGYPF